MTLFLTAVCIRSDKLGQKSTEHAKEQHKREKQQAVLSEVWDISIHKWALYSLTGEGTAIWAGQSPTSPPLGLLRFSRLLRSVLLAVQ